MAAPELFHLPDLPNAGYATARERELSDNIMTFLRDIERDRLRLLTIVLKGSARWRQVASSIWRGLKVGTEEIDAMFAYLELLACPPAVQAKLLKARQSPDTWRRLMAKAQPGLEAQREQLRLMAKWSPHGR